MTVIAATPSPSCYAVIFCALQGGDLDGNTETSARMPELAADQPGNPGDESAREGLGITISDSSDLESIGRWKARAEHREA